MNYLLRFLFIGFAGFFTLLLQIFSTGCHKGLKIDPLDLNQPPVISAQKLAAKPELVWTNQQQSSISALEMINASTLLVTTHRGEVYLVDIQTGNRIGKMWQPFYGGISSYILDRSNQLLFLASRKEEEIIVYDLQRQRKLWKKKFRRIIGEIAEYENQVYLCNQKGKVIGLDKRTGKKSKQVELYKRIAFGIVRWEDQLLVVTPTGELYSFTPGLKKNWHLETKIDINPIVITESTGITFINHDGAISQVTMNQDQPQVHYDHLQEDIYSIPLVINSQKLYAHANGEVFLFDPASNAAVWKYDSGLGLINLPLVFFESVCVVPYTRGWLIALEIDSGKEIWRYKTGIPLRHVLLSPEGIIYTDAKKNLTLLR